MLILGGKTKLFEATIQSNSQKLVKSVNVNNNNNNDDNKNNNNNYNNNNNNNNNNNIFNQGKPVS